MSKIVGHSFTFKAEGIVNMIAMPILISSPGQKQGVQIQGIWDTGASASVITQEVATALGLQPTGVTTVNTASQSNVRTNTYLVDIHLKSDLVVQTVQVTLGTISAEDGLHCLLGMDIINLGDFSITNHNNKTCMSFRVPSLHVVDYVEQTHLNNAPIANATPGYNSQPTNRAERRRQERLQKKNK